jgi:hypothetical protein
VLKTLLGERDQEAKVLILEYEKIKKKVGRAIQENPGDIFLLDHPKVPLTLIFLAFEVRNTVLSNYQTTRISIRMGKDCEKSNNIIFRTSIERLLLLISLFPDILIYS